MNSATDFIRPRPSHPDFVVNRMKGSIDFAKSPKENVPRKQASSSIFSRLLAVALPHLQIRASILQLQRLSDRKFPQGLYSPAPLPLD